MILEERKTALNNEIQLIGSDEAKGKTLIIGVVHGDEPQGEFLIRNYLKTHNELAKNFLFIPALNPDGLKLNTRTNSNGVDINRNFPTKNWEKSAPQDESGEVNRYFGGFSPASEIETKFVIEVIEKYQPSLIITLHTPFKVVNFDGPALAIAEKIGKIWGYKAEASIGYPTPGSFGTWAGVERNIPILTIEMDEEIPVNELILPFEEMLKLL